MPQIKPTSAQDLLKFIEDHRSDIENGTYDFAIEPKWVPDLPQDAVRFLAKNCSSPRTILADFRIPEDVFLILARDTNTDVRRHVASNKHTPVNVLGTLAGDEDVDVRRAVAHNCSAPVPILVILSKDNDIDVRRGVASNPKTPPESLSVLARGTNWEICEAVALNRNTPLGILETLSHNTGEGYISAYYGQRVREAVAANRSTPPHILEVLAKDKSSSVRDAVAANRSNMPPAEFYRKQKFWRNFWKVAPYSAGILGIIGLVTGRADVFLILISFGVLWALFVAKLGGPDATD